VSTIKLAPDWLPKSEQPIRSQESKLIHLLTMTTTHKFPLQATPITDNHHAHLPPQQQQQQQAVEGGGQESPHQFDTPVAMENAVYYEEDGKQVSNYHLSIYLFIYLIYFFEKYFYRFNFFLARKLFCSLKLKNFINQCVNLLIYKNAVVYPTEIRCVKLTIQ
jgi:hypothetical protein